MFRAPQVKSLFSTPAFGLGVFDAIRVGRVVTRDGPDDAALPMSSVEPPTESFGVSDAFGVWEILGTFSRHVIHYIVHFLCFIRDGL